MLVSNVKRGIKSPLVAGVRDRRDASNDLKHRVDSRVGVVAAIYRSTGSRSSLAARVHFSLTLAHLSPHQCLAFRKLARLRFLESALDGADEPFFASEIAFDRLVSHPCARAAHRAAIPSTRFSVRGSIRIVVVFSALIIEKNTSGL